jgi:hypothetical protein
MCSCSELVFLDVLTIKQHTRAINGLETLVVDVSLIIMFRNDRVLWFAVCCVDENGCECVVCGWYELPRCSRASGGIPAAQVSIWIARSHPNLKSSGPAIVNTEWGCAGHASRFDHHRR